LLAGAALLLVALALTLSAWWFRLGPPTANNLKIAD
jgi:hypothetical protein